MIRSVIVVLVLALIVSSVFAIWPVVGDTPWEADSSGGSRGPDDTGQQPSATKLQVTQAIRRAIPLDLRDRLGRMDAQFLGEGIWEVSIDIAGFNAGTLTAVYRVKDRGLVVTPLNDVAKALSERPGLPRVIPR